MARRAALHWPPRSSREASTSGARDRCRPRSASPPVCIWTMCAAAEW